MTSDISVSITITKNGNTLTAVNENENCVDFQNENNTEIKMMFYKTYKNENVFKENEKIR